MSLKDNFVIVTGGSRGIGAGIALELGKRGAKVVITYAASSNKAEEVVSKIKTSGTGDAISVQADCMDLSSPKVVIDATTKAFGDGIDIIVHNAGAGDEVWLKDIDAEHFDKLFYTNVRFPMFLTQRALPHLRRGGRIVNIGSVVGRQGWKMHSAYGATKAAVESLTRTWSVELGHEYGVTVNCVNPGPVNTDMWSAMPADALTEMEGYIKATPAAPRVGEVDDVVQVVAFLCEEGARWVTGSVTCANGGAVFVYEAKLFGSLARVGFLWTWNVVGDVSATASAFRCDKKGPSTKNIRTADVARSRATADRLGACSRAGQPRRVHRWWERKHEEIDVAEDDETMDLEWQPASQTRQWWQEDRDLYGISEIPNGMDGMHGTTTTETLESKELLDNPWRSSEDQPSTGSPVTVIRRDRGDWTPLLCLWRKLARIHKNMPSPRWDCEATVIKHAIEPKATACPANVVWHHRSDGSEIRFEFDPIKFDISGPQNRQSTPSIESDDEDTWSTCSSPCPKRKLPGYERLQELAELGVDTSQGNARRDGSNIRSAKSAQITSTLPNKEPLSSVKGVVPYTPAKGCRFR